MLEAVLGQIYTAVLLARLVTLEIAHRMTRRRAMLRRRTARLADRIRSRPGLPRAAA